MTRRDTSEGAAAMHGDRAGPSARELLAHLEQLGVRLSADGEKLRVSSTRGQLDERLRQQIQSSKMELLALLREASGGSMAVAAEDASGPVLSAFQERVWLLQRLEPENCAFIIVSEWLAKEGNDAQQVVDAIARLQARHDILRTRFAGHGQLPGARLAEASPPAVVDLSALHWDSVRARLKLDRENALRTPLDLEMEAVAQFTVYSLPDHRTSVRLRAHHIAVDASSIGLLRRELDAELDGAGSSGNRRPLQFTDYARWQRARLGDPDRVRDLDWWAETLRGAPQVCAFRPDRSSSPARETHAGTGGTIDFEWGSSLSDAVKGLARRFNATPYMVLLAGLGSLLRMHTGQGDIVLGSPMGTRERAEWESVVGPFVNLLVLRMDLSDDPSFGVAVQRARSALLDAHARRDVPFESILERLRPARSERHSPVFQVAVVQHETGAIEDMTLEGGGALHELTWYLREVDGGFRGSVEYSADHYSSAAVARLMSQVEVLLRDAAGDPQKPVSRLRVLDEAARRQVLATYNPAPVPTDLSSVHRQFERQVAAAPGRIALTVGNRDVGYEELNRRANRLATFLRLAGAGAGRVVAVCLERSIDMVATLLAVQKAGAAYLPLDPGFPADRLTYMVKDSGATLAVADAALVSTLTLPSHVRIIDPVADAAQIEICDDGNLPGDLRADDPVYVIYTSGSTGQPKGVVVPHGALSNFVSSMVVEPGLSPDDVLAAVTTISFDIAGLELYLPLVTGARVLLVDRESALDGAALSHVLASGQASVLQATPATWRMLIESGWRPTRPTRALCGGESLPRDLADALLDRVAELWNMYGPTETTIWSTLSRLDASSRDVTIGWPIANTQVYVVDQHGTPVPIGVPGEIWIGGRGVALGYHGRPELTAERFVPDGFSGVAGARLYRTGDVGYWDGEGRLYHLGRSDHQVKVRGFRIELGEIEAALAELPEVRQAVVHARDLGRGDHRLVAYVVVEPGSGVTTSEVRRALKRRLPDYMIPSLIVELPTFPLTPNGKIDRAALPDPYGGARDVAESKEPPKPGIEATIAEIWKQVLKIESVDAGDNFFDLGGHSLLTFRVVAMIHERTGRKLDPRQLFFQSLRQVAEATSAVD